MITGSMPRDGGHLILAYADAEKLTKAYPETQKLIRPYIGTDELISGNLRRCLWIEDDEIGIANSVPEIVDRLSKVSEMRTSSPLESTRQFSDLSHRFVYLAGQASAASIEAFVRANVKTGTTLLTDGHRSYPGLTDYRHDPRTVGKMAGHIVLPWIHRVFALMKRWGLGTYHGLRREHIDTYLNEFVFRYNRRFYRHVSFETMLGLASHHHPTSYWDIIGRDNPRKGVPTVRRQPRRRKTATGMQADRSTPPEKVELSPVSASTR